MNYNLNVLFIDDSQPNVEITAAEFRKQGFKIEYNHVNTCNDLLDKLNKNSYDLIVSEYNLSTTSVTDVLCLLSELALEIPLIVISDNNNEKDIIKTIKAGCRDYLVRSSISRLKHIVVRILCETERCRELKEAQKQLFAEKECFVTTIESIGEGLIVTDISGRITLINNTAKQLTELYQKEASGMYVEEVLKLTNKQGQNLVRSIFDQVIKTGLSTGLKRDTVLTTYSGDVRYASATISPIRNHDGAITGVVIIFRDITRLRNLEKELEEEQRNLSIIFDTAPVGLVILDSNLVVRRVNSALINFLRKSADSMINKRIGSSINCIKSTQSSKGCGFGSACKFCSLCRIISDVNDTGIAVYGKEIQISVLIEEKKEDLWSRVNSVPIFINGNNYVMLAVDDITQNKKIEEALARSRDFYLTLFENFPALIRRAGPDAKCNYFNRSWLEFTGRTMEEELGDGWSTGVHPDDLEKCFNTYIGAFNARQSFEMEYRLRRSDGEYRLIYDAGRPFYDTEGSFLGYIGSCYDITEKRNELELLSKYQLLSEKANDIIIFMDSKGNILEVNETAVSKYGYTREEFRMLTFFDLHKSEDISIINEYLDTIWTRSMIFNTTHFRKDGSSFPVEASWSGAKIGNSKMVLCVVRDNTERKQFQENLENRNKELHDALEKLKYTQSQLVQQEKLAAIGQLAAGVAHEINNPLGFVMSNVETLEKYSIRLKEVLEKYAGLKGVVKEADIEEAMRVLNEIGELEKRYHVDLITEDLKTLLDDTNDGLSRISKIVLGLRIFSRVDNQDKMTDYDLNAGIENTILVANNEIKYYADIEKNLGDIPLVALSGNQINQVLLNIVINAVHAIKERQDGQRGLIKIFSYMDSGYICCDIEDNGTGIPEENLNRIFDPFFTTKPVGQGTGLGLSISYDIIVNKHGGEINVKGTPGKGAVFSIKLPVTGGGTV